MEKKSNVKLIRFFLILFTSCIALIFALMSCGGGGGDGVSTGTVTTSITDPPICQAPNGPFNAVWVTITRVRAHTSSDAGSNDGGWVDLIDLRDNPRQINLLDLDSTECLLTELGSTGGIPVGKYQQIRLHLLSNSPSPSEKVPSGNPCGANGYNCVVMGDETKTLLLSSQSNTGIKIPPGQISGGGLTVSAGQTVDLNIDFDACSSIVLQGNGQYRLKPTLRAGEVTINTNAISGRVIDFNTKEPIPNAIVALETRDSEGISRIATQKLTGPNGGFIFCPLPQGTSTYDVVAVAPDYNATVTLQAPIGQMGDIPLRQETGGTLPATISGQVTTVNISSAATSANVKFSALQSVPITGGSLLVTIPLPTGSISNVVTAANTQSDVPCPAGTYCADYKLIVPASNPWVGVFSASITYTKLAATNVTYRDEARAFTSSMDDSVPNCSPNNDFSDVTVPVSRLITENFSFTRCQ